MEDEDEIFQVPTPRLWIPMSDPVDIAVFGKLGEELGELTAIKDRCMIQGLDEADPDTGEINRAALEKELADVQAMIDLTIDKYKLDRVAMNLRTATKYAFKMRWLAMLEHHVAKQTEAKLMPLHGCTHPRCPAPNWTVGYGLAGGGMGMYEYCEECHTVINKVQDHLGKEIDHEPE